MNARFSALLCLGLAACSNKTEDTAVNDPSYVDEHRQVTEPTMTPASLEAAKPAPATTPTPTPTTDDRPTPTTAPLVADTKGTNPNDFKSTTRTDDAKKPVPADAAAPDNTKVNERDTNNATPTPGDQGNNASDLKITQKIRQAVMADGSLSFTAKNVKIITQNGKVTLRGPVNSEDERSRIEAAARKVAGTAQVDNQLEVKK